MLQLTMLKIPVAHSRQVIVKKGNIPSSAIVSKETRRMEKMGKIDGLIGADNVGYIVDQQNQFLEKKIEKEYNNEITARNKYYAPLWKRVIEEMR